MALVAWHSEELDGMYQETLGKEGEQLNGTGRGNVFPYPWLGIARRNVFPYPWLGIARKSLSLPW